MDKPSGITMVELVAGELKGIFSIEHAERLLRRENNGGWKIPDNSPFQYTVENGINYRSDSATDTKQGEKRSNRQSKAPTAED